MDIWNMNLLGANIPYPYDVPNRTTKSMVGYWSLVGFMEKMENDAKETGDKKRRFQVDGTGKG